MHLSLDPGQAAAEAKTGKVSVRVMESASASYS